MNLLHRHIFANVLVTCASSVAVLGFIVMMGHALKELLPYLLSGQLGIIDFLRLSAMTLPFVAYYALPPGMLIGILLVLGRMSSDREITAMRASGLSVAWLSAPILFLAVLGVGLGLLTNFYFMPKARVAALREKEAVIRRSPLEFIVARTYVRDFKGVVIYVGEIKDKQFKDFWAWELDAQNRVRRFAHADTAHLNYDEANRKLSVTLEQAYLEMRDDKDPENFARVRTGAAGERATFDLSLDKMAGERVSVRKPKLLTFPQLMAEWTRLKLPDPTLAKEEQQLQLMRVQIAIHDKFSMAFSVLSFALVAIPLGIKVSRKETSANLAIGLLLFFGYYFCTAMAGLFENKPEFRPDLLMWLPNLVFQGLGFWLFYKVDRART